VSECALAASLWSSSSSSCPFLLFSSSVCGFVLRTWRLVLLRYFLIVCRTHTRREERDANTRRRRRMPEGTTGGDPTLPNEGARDPLQLVTSHLSFPIFFSGGFPDMRALAFFLLRTSLACALLFSCLRTSSSLAAYEIAIRQTYLQPRLPPKEDKGAWTVRCREEQRLSSLHSSRLPTTCQPQPLFSLFAFVKHALSLHIIKTNRA